MFREENDYLRELCGVKSKQKVFVWIWDGYCHHRELAWMDSDGCWLYKQPRITG